MSFSTRVTGIALTKDIGIGLEPTTESGFPFPPTECLEPSSMCHPVFAMFPQDTGTSRMEMSERTGGLGRSRSTGKGTEEGNGMERSGGILTGVTTIGEKAEEDTAIRLFLENVGNSSGEMAPCAHFSRAIFRRYSPSSPQ